MAETKLTFKEQLESFKNELKDFFSTDKLAFADYKLSDGTIVRSDVDPIAVGAQLQSVSDSGVVPLADGEYTVVTDAGNLSITVVSGYATEVETAAAEAAEPVDAAKKPAVPAANPAVNPVTNPTEKTSPEDMIAKHAAALDNHEGRIQKMEAQIGTNPAVVSKMEATEKSLTKEIEKLKLEIEKSNSFSKKLFALVEELGEMTPEATHKPANRTSTKELTDKEKVSEFRKKFLKTN